MCEAEEDNLMHPFIECPIAINVGTYSPWHISFVCLFVCFVLFYLFISFLLIMNFNFIIVWVRIVLHARERLKIPKEEAQIFILFAIICYDIIWMTRNCIIR